MKEIVIPRDIAGEIVESARAGESPSNGLEYVTVGRLNENRAYINAFEYVEQGGYKVKLLKGESGSGKTTELRHNRGMALQRGYVTMFAKLIPGMKLYSTNGSSLALWKALVEGMSPSLDEVLGSFLGKAKEETPEDGDVLRSAEKLLRGISGVDESHFRKIVLKWCQGRLGGDMALCDAAIRWLKGEYNRCDTAREELGKDVQAILSDGNQNAPKWYSILKCMVQFSVMAGFKAVAVYLDETYNLYKIDNSRVRDKNYEMLHAIITDRIPYCQLMFTGTEQSVKDRRKGLYSYGALASRLETAVEEDENRVDRYQTVDTICPLKPEDILLLLLILKKAYDSYYDRVFPVSDRDVLSVVNDYLVSTTFRKYLTTRSAMLRFSGIMNKMIDHPELSFTDCRIQTPVTAEPNNSRDIQSKIKEL